ncbi:Retinoic acid receptor RXR-gamma [Trichinella spiralis]|uniref:Retinoic acid receptor RXR-gamma n=1 Tax=Trichinella spiralis TaxID=6334 RepID=A0ABR3L0U8_TRISP
MHEIAFLRFSLAKKTTRLQKVVEALLNFEEGYPFDGDQVCVSRTPRRPDLPYINPQIEDTHPFPLILSEIASEHQNNVYPNEIPSFAHNSADVEKAELLTSGDAVHRSTANRIMLGSMTIHAGILFSFQIVNNT